MPLEPAFLFSHELLQNALPELLSQTGTTGRQFAQLLIRVWQEPPQNFPESSAPRRNAATAKMPLSLDAVMAICEHYGCTSNGSTVTAASRAARWCDRVSKAPGTVLLNKRLRNQHERLKYELAFFIGTRSCTTATAPFRRTARRCPRAEPGGSAGHGAQDVLYAWRDFECSFFAGALLCRACRSGAFSSARRTASLLATNSA